MSIEKKTESMAEKVGLGDRIASSAERIKEHESNALHAARDAVAKGSERAEQVLHRATDATADAARRASEQAAHMRERGQEQFEAGRAKANQSLDQVFDYVRDNPGKSIAMAVVGGWLLGNILRRR